MAHIQASEVGDLVMTSTESNESGVEKVELYHFLEKGEEDLRAGRKSPAHEVFAEIKREVERETP
jgi:hypothetical protein